MQHHSESAEQRSEQHADSTLHQGAASTLQQPAAALMQAEAMAAYTRSVLEPLVTALERSEDHARTLERENGRLTAELERAASTVVALGEENATLRASQAQQVADPGPSAPPPITDAPVPLPARLSYLAPWVLLVTTLGVVAFALALSR